MGAVIAEIKIEPFNLPLKESFNITLGSMEVTENVLLKVVLDNGIVGYGEGACADHITGDIQNSMAAVLNYLRKDLMGAEIRNWRKIIEQCRKTIAFHPGAFWALETALLDAYTQTLDIPLYEFLGGMSTQVETDITISITSQKRAVELAQEGKQQGFKIFKIKVGTNLAEDLDRVRAVAQTVPEAQIRIDANQGYNPKAAVQFIQTLWRENLNLTLFEQPVPWGNLAGLKYVQEHSPVPVAADETVFTAHHAWRVLQERAADVINIKLAKSGGILEALDIIALAKAAGVELMLGCMLESNVGLAPSVHLACGTGAFSYLDLDSHLLIASSPLKGGFRTQGSILAVDDIASGLGFQGKC